MGNGKDLYYVALEVTGDVFGAQLVLVVFLAPCHCCVGIFAAAEFVSVRSFEDLRMNVLLAEVVLQLLSLPLVIYIFLGEFRLVQWHRQCVRIDLLTT